MNDPVLARSLSPEGIHLVSVRFVDDVKIPHLGEKKGLSLARVRGGNDEFVEHTIIFHPEVGLVEIASLRPAHADHPPVLTPMSQVKWMEILTPEMEAQILDARRPAPPPPVEEAPPADTAETATPAPRGKKSKGEKIGMPGVNVMVGGDDD